jgi:hypothetical protein
MMELSRLEAGFGFAQGVRDRCLAEAKDSLRNPGCSRRFCPARDGTHPRGGESSGILSTRSVGRRVNKIKDPLGDKTCLSRVAEGLARRRVPPGRDAGANSSKVEIPWEIRRGEDPESPFLAAKEGFFLGSMGGEAWGIGKLHGQWRPGRQRKKLMKVRMRPHRIS